MKKGADAPASPTKSTHLSLMPANASNTPQVNRRDLDNDYLCPACGARYLPDRFALECEVCAAEDHTVAVEF